MIGVLTVKDLQSAARNWIFRLTLTVYLLAFLAASLFFFSVFLSSDGNAFRSAGEALFFRISLMQGILIAGLTPWILFRMHAQDLSTMPFAGNLVVPPGQLLPAKLCASAVYIAILLLLGLPVFIFARHMGAATYRDIVWLMTDTFLFLMVLTSLVFHLYLHFRNWAVSWILSYAALAALAFCWSGMRSSLSHGSSTLLLLLLFVLFGILLIPHGNRTLLYERD